MRRSTPWRPRARRPALEIKQSLLEGLKKFKQGGNAESPQDLFASLGDHWCFYNSPREGGLVMTGLTGVVPITDRKQFSRSYEVVSRLAMDNLPDDGFGSNNQRIRRFRFAGGDVHYANVGALGIAPSWWAGDKEFVMALAPQNIKAYLSRGSVTRSLADVPEVAAELSGRDPLLAIGYLDAPRLFESIYPLLIYAAPSYLGANGFERRPPRSVDDSLAALGQPALAAGADDAAANQCGAGTGQPRQLAGLWAGGAGDVHGVGLAVAEPGLRRFRKQRAAGADSAGRSAAAAGGGTGAGLAPGAGPAGPDKVDRRVRRVERVPPFSGNSAGKWWDSLHSAHPTAMAGPTRTICIETRNSAVDAHSFKA